MKNPQINNSKNRRWAFLLILLVGVVLRLVSAIMLGDKIELLPAVFDQVSYHTLANRLLSGHGFTFAQDWWPATHAGQPTAHWSYLYTLYLAGVYFLFGNHPLAARVVQALISGLVMPWLTYRITVRTFHPLRPQQVEAEENDLFGLIAAAWVAVYPYFLYYASALMTETFYMVGILWTLDCGMRIGESQTGIDQQTNLKNWLELGLALGFTVLLRQVVLLWVPFLFLWVCWGWKCTLGWKKGLQKIIMGIVLSAVIVIGLIAPFTALNYAHFGRFVLLNNNSGYAFYWSNHPIHGDKFIPLLKPGMPSYQDLIPAELRSLDEAALDQALLKLGVKFVVSDPARYLRLSISRIPVLFNFWPLKESSLPSNLTRVFSFGLALPFALAGILIWFKRVRQQSISGLPGVLLLSFVIIYSAIHLLSWAQVRYRIPIDAVLLVFAASALQRLLTKTGLLPVITKNIYAKQQAPKDRKE